MTELVNRGWEVHLACSPDDGTDSFEVLRSLRGVTLHAVPMARPLRPLQDARSFGRWLALVGRVRPELVVASTPKAGLLALVAARLRRVPSRIYHVRGLRSEGLGGVLAAASRASEYLAAGASTAVLVDSPSLLYAMRQVGLLKPEAGTVLGSGSSCGVDSNWFRPPSAEERLDARARLGIHEQCVVVGFIGRITADKGVRELLEAMSRLRHTYPGLRLVLAGAVEESNVFTQSLSTAYSADWVTMTGRVPESRDIYWSLDIFCLPSYREGFPISSLEAQSCGLPVVTTDATGCIDSVISGRTGLVVPVGDTNAVTRALRNLVDDESLRISMGNSARERVLREFDEPIVRTQVVEFIEGAMKQGRSSIGSS